MKIGFIVLLLLAALSLTSDPRLSVLTGDSRLLLDDFNEMWAFPGTISKYQFGSISSVVNKDLESGGEKWKVGWFGGVMNSNGTSWGATYDHGESLLEVLFNPGNFGIIVGVDYAANEYVKFEQIQCVRDKLAFNASFGTGLTFPVEYSDVSAGAKYSSVEYEVEDSTIKTTELCFDASLRGHMDNAFFNLFPVMSAGFLRTDIQDSTVITTISMDFGIAANRMITSETRLIAGVFIGFVKTSPDEGDAVLVIDLADFKAGIEQQINSWLVLRAGAESVTDRIKEGEKDAVISTTVSSSFGLGFEIYNFVLDASINESFLHTGPHIISGSTSGFLGNLSCTFYF